MGKIHLADTVSLKGVGACPADTHDFCCKVVSDVRVSQTITHPQTSRRVPWLNYQP